MNRFTAAFVGLFLFGIVVAGCVIVFQPQKNDAAMSDFHLDGFSVILDAGHGGEDGGTSAADGTLEKTINLQIAEKLEPMLNACGYQTIMLRESDSLIGDNSLPTVRQRKVSDIRRRLSAVELNPDSLLISIHQNHFSAPQYSGAQVFYSGNHPQSRLLAECIQEKIVSRIQPQNTREIKKSGSNIYLLYHCQTPAVMVECGFLSNPQEADLLKNEEYQKEMAFAVLCGILKYLE
ncbi:MAG TPA: hypothetical protein DDY98_06430 [Ruminococcaceae bacterium]|nr:hypothetical protein [Oscillospiraceae bacterium]